MREFINEIGNNFANEATVPLPQNFTDVFQPKARETGLPRERTAKALLSPLRSLLWNWEQIEELAIDGVDKRLEEIPGENRKIPDFEIAVPLLQALSYSAQNETLKEMYLNLLTNSMDRAQETIVNPSFVEIIKQMNSLDAKVFCELILREDAKYMAIVNPSIEISWTDKTIKNAAPEWFLGWSIDGYDIFDISISLTRLNRLGLLELMFDRAAHDENQYAELYTSPYLISILEQCQKAHPGKSLDIFCTKSSLHINEYGKQFADSCLSCDKE